MKKRSTAVAVRSVEDYANEFGIRFRAGVSAIKDAGIIYADALRAFGANAERVFMERYPGVAHKTWTVLRHIGQGRLNPNVLLLPFAAARKFELMPIETQNRIFDSGTNGFKVVSRTTMEERILPVTALTAKCAEILIDEKEGRVRTVEEQRAYLVGKRKFIGGVEGTVVPKYIIVGKLVRIGSSEFDLETMRQIVAELEANAK